MASKEPTPVMVDVAEQELRDESAVDRPLCLPDDLPEGAQTMNFLGVDYVHLKTSEDGDLYLTLFGLPFWQHLQPHNWLAREWFVANRERLGGTSTVYRLPTRAVNDTSLELVVKWSRVGEVIPMDTFTINQFVNAEFNSPFEEFSILMELRKGRAGPPGIRIRTQHPLAIYVPSKRMQLWQTGRSEDKIKAKIARHPGVEIDILRQYVVLFRWVKGRDAVETAEDFGFEGRKRDHFVSHTNSVVVHELAQKGYRVMDMKPSHVILRPKPKRKLVRERTGQFAYALIDYELLQRTPEHEAAMRGATRRRYLKEVANPFDFDGSHPLPPHLHFSPLLGVDYLYGHAESTGGLLWVVGRNPDLFHYFLPERWRRTPKRALSAHNQVFYTRTKDGINLVWKVSRMGEPPWPGGASHRAQRARDHGFNSPFEEFALALELNRRGIKTTHPRAIYRTGQPAESGADPPDLRRYEAMAALKTPDGQCPVCPGYDYITVWGYWKRRERSTVEETDGDVWATNAVHALRRGLITREQLTRMLRTMTARLSQAGFEDLNLKADHLLLPFDLQRNPVLDENGDPDMRLCNLELLRGGSISGWINAGPTSSEPVVLA
jgi:hypothetical protein